MYGKVQEQLTNTLSEIREAGLFKMERIIESPQEAHINVTGGKSVLNMCANNYLGLSDHPDDRRGGEERAGRMGIWAFVGAVYLRDADDPQGA